MDTQGPTHLLYSARTGRTVAPGPLRCCLCACSCADTTPAREILSETFTNHSMLRAPSEPGACLACAHYFAHRWDCGQKYPAEYRKHSHLVTSSLWTPWQRQDMRSDIQRFLSSPLEEDALLVVALSKKKHCLPLARVNPAGSRSLWVQVEEQRCRLTLEAWAILTGIFDALLALSFAKGEILSGVPRTDTLRKLPPQDQFAWRALWDALAPWRPSTQLTLVSYVTLAQEDSQQAPAGENPQEEDSRANSE